MQRRLQLIPLILILALPFAMPAAGNNPGFDTRIVDLGQVEEPTLSAACNFTKTNGTASVIWGTTSAGAGLYTYYDASVCGPASYPFEITDFSFSLYDDAGRTIWPGYFDIVVRELATPGNPCGGPGAEICRQAIVVDQATFAYPNVGTVTLTTPCCVDGPFFMGLEATQGEPNTTPGLIWDNQTIPDCEGWALYAGVFVDYNTWPPDPVPRGYPLYWIGGNPNSVNCGGGPCLWSPGDDHKMHFPQLPDASGWDVMACKGQILADDWQCSETGWVTDIHFWGGWKLDNIGTINGFWVKVYGDVPADPPQNPYSKPGELLWEGYFAEADFSSEEFVQVDDESWWNPSNGSRVEQSSPRYYQYNICLDEQTRFWQEAGSVYWLSITADVAELTTEWGWKSTTDHWNDNAVWAAPESFDWIEVWEPAPPLGSAFAIQFDAAGDTAMAFAYPAYGDGWYYYPESEWWNTWFYDHPYDPNRMKAFELSLDEVLPTSPDPAYIEIAINWATDLWSLDQAPEDSFPPLPGVDEGLYIGRHIIYAGDPTQSPPEHFYGDTIFEYNPEWVSIDARGYNVSVFGALSHECRGPMDLAFVITGFAPEADEACCLPDGSCSMLTPTECANLGGIAMGPGTTCSAPEACCLPDGSCEMLDPVCCEYLDGTPQGGGTTCADVTCGQVCDCIPGDANGDGFFPPYSGGVNVGDAVYLISYVFKGGPGATPYPICSGDANCDCAVNVGDAVYIISYVFKGGPPPCTCEEWVAMCGWPLRK